MATNVRKGEKPNNYFSRLKHYRVLHPVVEIELAKKVYRWQQLSVQFESYKKNNINSISITEFCQNVQIQPEDFERIFREGKKAKNQLIYHNLKLVIVIAKKYTNCSKVSLDDLIQEGNIGLIRATEKFNPSLGYKFSTYAYWWIRQQITRAINNSARTIRLPTHIYEKLSKIKKGRLSLTTQLKREPTFNELANFLGLTISQLQEYSRLAQQPVSLSAFLNDDGQEVFGDFVADPLAEQQIWEINYNGEQIEELISILPPRYQYVVRQRIFEDKTLDAIAHSLNISRERVRQIFNKGLSRLREKLLKN